jgi:two-component system KDP operon response regulator KdpE
VSSAQPAGVADQAAARSDAEKETGRRGTALLFRETSAGPIDHARRITDGGWECVVAHDVERARWLASVRNFGLIVLAGETLRWSRDALNTIRPLTVSPVLALSPDLDEAQAPLLRLGADMVVDSACRAELFRSAIQALVRRAVANEPVLRYLEAQGLRIDLWGRRTTLDGADVSLTPTEFDILRLLMAQSQIAVKHHEIIKAVWSWKYTDERNALRLQINRLRSKLADASGRPRFIRSVRGVGYVFDKPVAEFAGDRDTPKSTPIRENVNLLLEGRLRSLTKSLIECASRAEACAVLVETVVAEGMCDGAAVFARRPGLDILDLVAQAGMSATWQLAVAGGLPLGDQFLATDTFNTREIRHYVDISKLARRYRPTVRLMRAAQLPAQLSIPLADHHGAWGQLGFGRRSDSPFTTPQCMVLEAAGAVLGALFADQPRRAAAVS